MQQFNFQPLNFSTLEGYQQRYDQARQVADEARRRKYDAFGNVITAAGQGASDTVNAYGDWRKEQDALERQEEQQRKADEWRQKQWDYQVGRDRIADTRYNQQQDQATAERLDDMRRAGVLTKGFLDMYDNPEMVEKYGPHAGFALERMRNARTWQDAVAAGESLSSIIQQRDMLDAQREEQRRANMGPEFSNQVASRMSLMGIDPRDPEGSVYRMREPDFYKDEDTRYRINRDLQRLDAMIEAGYGNQAMYDQRAALYRASEALRRRMYRTDNAGNSMVDRYGRYTRQQDF